jgi:hypothetical protein
MWKHVGRNLTSMFIKLILMQSSERIRCRKQLAYLYVIMMES